MSEVTTYNPNNKIGMDIASLEKNEISLVCSFVPETIEQKKALYNSINSADESLGDHINETIALMDVVLNKVEMVNEDTGELEPGVRTIIIDTDGVKYACASTGVYRSIINIYALFGTLHFEGGFPVTVKQINVKRGKALTLVL